ncbi:MAG: hypothetical protein P8J20_02980 [Novosphingobium sp.]|nr:hypothetical protein [Novosphingobium sp.]
MSLLLAILAQIGPFPQSGMPPVSPLPPEILERKRTERERVSVPADPPPSPLSLALAECLVKVKNDPVSAADSAAKWLAEATGVEQAEAGQCRGVALSRQERWDDAEAAFLDAYLVAEPESFGLRARLAAMAGNAALAHGDAPAALSAFETARTDVGQAGDQFLTADIAIDRSLALVALGRDKEARDSLAQARNASPSNPQAWLLSATLSRRMDELAMAQVQIEEAVRLLPLDPEIGLEAGVIAVLAGKDDSARKSWQSVVKVAPDSEAAGIAQAYLVQLGDEETPSP